MRVTRGNEKPLFSGYKVSGVLDGNFYHIVLTVNNNVLYIQKLIKRVKNLDCNSIYV